ncbi:hypothetical protein ABGB12_26020 [Actinocorallia sp. B10E7]|uniref:hypothetical protein n=1 Tax=Actinocorallia sp. B10E7 TaxID=3153558 RepID=UPI00325E9065
MNADGSSRALKTREMDQGIGFANPKSTARNLHFALSGGGAVGVYNHEHTDGGYLNQVRPWFAFTKTKIHSLGQSYDGDLTYTVFGRDSGEKTGTVSLPMAMSAQSRAACGSRTSAGNVIRSREGIVRDGQVRLLGGRLSLIRRKSVIILVIFGSCALSECER